MKKILVVAVLFVLAAGLVTAQEKAQTKKSVLIAAQKSAFKDAVILRVSESVKKEAAVKIIDSGKLKKENLDDYAVILLVNTIMGGRVVGPAGEFLKTADENTKKKTVVFTTAGGGVWKPQDKNVDAVASASVPADVNTVADSIVQKVHNLLK